MSPESSPADVMDAPEPRRRRGDWAQSPTMIETVRYLISRPQVDQLAQFLVLNLLSAHRPMSAVISTFALDGSLHSVSTFGNAPGGTESYRHLSLWDAMPMCAAVRSGSVLVIDRAELETDYAGLAKAAPEAMAVGASSLAVPGEQVGAVQLSFAATPDDEALARDLSGVTAVLALYLDLVLNGGRAQLTGDPDSVHQAEGRHETKREAAPAALSERQLTILGLLSKGLTNAQIASRIGFSESTVRQETMAIYRFLDVDGRHEAARAAAARGLV